MWWDRRRPWTVLVPPLVAGLLMLLFFALTDRWDNLENPIASQLAVVFGLVGFLAGMAVQRIRRWELVAIPGALTVAVAVWSYVFPHETPEDSDFREILAVLAVILLIATVVINLPQLISRRPTRGSDQ